MISIFRLCSSLFGIATQNRLSFVTPYATVLVINILLFIGGYGLSPDSIYYSSGAYNLLNEGHLRGFSSYFFDQFPPGMSFVLLPIEYIPVSNWILVLNLSSGLVLAHFLRKIFLMFLPGIIRPNLYLSLYFISVYYIEIASMLWSENIFNACVAYFFVNIFRYRLSAGVHFSTNLALIVNVWIAYSFRWVGVLLALVLFTIVLKTRSIGSAILIFCSSLLPLLAWYLTMYRPNNVSLFGSRFPSTSTPKDALVGPFRAIGSGLLPDSLLHFNIFLGLLITAIFILSIFKNRHSKDLNLISGAVVLYFAFLIYSSLSTQIDPVDPRLLSPVMPFLFLVCIIYFLDFTTKRSWYISNLLVLLLIFSIGANGIHLLNYVAQSNRVEIYTLNDLAERFQRVNPVEKRSVFSTDPWRTWIKTNHSIILQWPLENDYQNPVEKTRRDLKVLENILAREETVVLYCYETPEECSNIVYSFIDEDNWSFNKIAGETKFILRELP